MECTEIGKTIDRKEETLASMKRWLTYISDSSALSTILDYYTKEYETVYIDHEYNYFLLQNYQSEQEAFDGHHFWVKKCLDGFVPTEGLTDNFWTKAFLKFLKLSEKSLKEKNGMH